MKSRLPKAAPVRAFAPDSAPSDEATYLEWRDAKVRRAQEAAKKNPDDRIPLHEMWRKYGLEP